jgi:sugar/nucleoside kinase (ribokinase family)
MVHAPAVGDPVDTVGAGDAFCAGMAVARAEGLQPGRVLSFANACGALAVTARGAQPSFPRRQAVLELLAQEPPEPRGRR